jgi:hypothetical protein
MWYQKSNQINFHSREVDAALGRSQIDLTFVRQDRQAASGLARLQFFWPATRARGGGNGQWLLELYKLRTPPQISLIIASINYCTNALQYSIIYGLARVDFKIVL